MATKLWVEMTECSNCTQPKGEVGRVMVLIGDSSWPQVEGRSRPDTIVKVWLAKTRGGVIKTGEAGCIVVIEPRGPCKKGPCQGSTP